MVQVGLKFTILWSPPPQSWDDRWVSPHLALTYTTALSPAGRRTIKKVCEDTQLTWA